MKRQEVKTALEIFWRTYPELSSVDFAIQQVNVALEEAAVEISDAPTVENAMGTIRDLKIKG